MSGARPHVDALTGLRFFAALVVVLDHFARTAMRGAPSVLLNLLSGDAAVTLFFMLSGFVLTYRYSDPAVRLSATSFWWARWTRIYPLYLVSLLLATPFVLGQLSAEFDLPVAARKAVAYAVPVFTMTQSWLWQTANKWNYPAWSLSAEAFFYLLFPLLLTRMARGGGAGDLGTRRLVWRIGGLWALSVVVPLLYLVLFPDRGAGRAGGEVDPWFTAITALPLLHLPTFVAGMLLANAHLAWAGRATNRHTAWRWREGMALAGLGGAAAILATNHHPLDLLIHNGLLTPLFALLILGLAGSNGPLARLLSTPPLLRLGEASFALYILQVPVWQWLVALVERLPGGDALDPQGLLFLTVYVMILIGLSLASVALLERPARVLLTRAVRRRAQRAIEPGQLAVTAVAQPELHH